MKKMETIRITEKKKWNSVIKEIQLENVLY